MFSEAFRELCKPLEKQPIILYNGKEYAHGHLSWICQSRFQFPFQVLSEFDFLIIAHKSFLNFLSLFIEEGLCVNDLRGKGTYVKSSLI